jgi:hypothetical protein
MPELTATAIMLDFDSKHRFFPVAGYDPLQELLEGTFYTTMFRQMPTPEEWIKWRVEEGKEALDG